MRVLDTTWPKARKAHRCDDCSRTIEAGEHYWRQKSIGDDGLQEFVLCAHCSVLFDWICRVDPYAVDDDFGLNATEWMRETGHDIEGSSDPHAPWRGVDFPQLNSEFAGQWAGVDLEELRARLRPVPDAAAAVRP